MNTQLRVVVVTSCGTWPGLQPGQSFPCVLLGGCALFSTGLSSQLLQPRVRRIWARSFFLTILYLLLFASRWGGEKML